MKQRRTIALALGCALMSSSFSAEHEYYVSVGEMRLNSETLHLEITQKVFTDDLEYALEMMGHPGVDVLNDEVDEELSAYLEHHFAVWSASGELLELRFLGREGDADAIYLFLESTDKIQSQKLQIKHEVLMEVFPAQINILHVGDEDNRLSYQFTEDSKVQQVKI